MFVAINLTALLVHIHAAVFLVGVLTCCWRTDTWGHVQLTCPVGQMKNSVPWTKSLTVLFQISICKQTQHLHYLNTTQYTAFQILLCNYNSSSKTFLMFTKKL